MRLIIISKKYQAVLGIVLTAIILSFAFGFGRLVNPDYMPAYITLAVMVISAILFVTEVVSLPVTAMSIPIILALTGVVTPGKAFQGFANDNVILFASMFIIGGALFKTGVTQTVGNLVVELTKGSERRLLIGIVVMVSIFSAFLSNTGTVAVLLPVCIGIVDAAGWSRKNILMVLAMAASTGGMITLVGTPPNITVNAVLGQYDLQQFSFFEYAWVGIPLTILGGVYLVLTCKTSAASGFKQEVMERKNIWADFGKKQILAIMVMAGVVIAMASGIISLHIAAALGALICVLAGLLTEAEVIESIDWTTIFLFSGTLVLADALDKTGAGKMIADIVIRMVGTNTNELVLLTALFVLAVVLTQFMSNTASCALLAPIGIQIAQGLSANPRGALMIIAIASSSAFATPMATPPNTLVMGPARLTMKDYLKTGIPLILISYVICMIVVPRVWPLY